MIWAILSLALGGILKGATGAGAPIIAIPALTMVYDVRLAVTLMILPNLLSNVWQGWAYRRAALPAGFLLRFCIAGGLGVLVGSWMLAFVSADLLSLLVAVGVIAYIAMRIMPRSASATLGYPLARRVAGIAGLAGGLLQGATGLSAPVSLSFLNAMRLERATFIATISAFFVCVTAVQAPALFALGFLTWDRLLLSLGALIVLSAFMPLGRWLARRWSPQVFDRVILVLLGAIAIRILAGLV
ncbi:sulfite exporter TauE/SafE family protein [Halodurantibacterium flavum]|uniref:Probable membrane transporter protein n=1 Tax=Halodurantibacterium flavum TaxID=1382802 RepID=A0ABW4S1Z6_9RHOB